MNTIVTIASVRAHGVRRLFVYCRGKREGDWPCHHEEILAMDTFADDEALHDIQCRCDARRAGGGEPIFVLTTACSRPPAKAPVG